MTNEKKGEPLFPQCKTCGAPETVCINYSHGVHMHSCVKCGRTILVVPLHALRLSQARDRAGNPDRN
jgi:translation initiation factor 2 beta subunit (eIF-2beta)/eIF-5